MPSSSRSEVERRVHELVLLEPITKDPVLAIAGIEVGMKQRERWRCGLRLDFGEAQALRNTRRGSEAQEDPRFDRRLRAILLVGAERYTQEAAAKIFEVDTNSITRWVMAYQKGSMREGPIHGAHGRRHEGMLSPPDVDAHGMAHSQEVKVLSRRQSRSSDSTRPGCSAGTET